jgi:mannosyltransferase OCH1-like enzyme
MGGMYLDMDMKPLRSFDDLFTEETYCLEHPDDAKSAGYDRLISNAMMVCEKQSRLMKNVIYYIVNNLPTKGDKRTVINQTGPGLVTKVFNETNETARVLDHDCFYPNSFSDRNRKRDGTYATHMFASSWHSQC